MHINISQANQCSRARSQLKIRCAQQCSDYEYFPAEPDKLENRQVFNMKKEKRKRMKETFPRLAEAISIRVAENNRDSTFVVP